MYTGYAHHGLDALRKRLSPSAFSITWQEQCMHSIALLTSFVVPTAHDKLDHLVARQGILSVHYRQSGQPPVDAAES
jgi:hypothetical protein